MSPGKLNSSVISTHTDKVFILDCLEKSSSCKQQSGPTIFSLLTTNWERESKGENENERCDERDVGIISTTGRQKETESKRELMCIIQWSE